MLKLARGSGTVSLFLQSLTLTVLFTWINKVNVPADSDLTNLDVLDCLFLSIIPEAIVQPQADQFQWWLRAKCVFSRHVEVIHEVYQLLATDWYIHTLMQSGTAH